MKLLLDTQVFLRLVQQEPLPARALDQLQHLENELFLSLVTPWEMQIKAAIGKLSLSDSVRTITQTQLAQSSIRLLPITLDHVDVLALLPDHHRDPFDRLLVAQAIHENLTIVTGDEMIGRYPVQTLWR